MCFFVKTITVCIVEEERVKDDVEELKASICLMYRSLSIGEVTDPAKKREKVRSAARGG